MKKQACLAKQPTLSVSAFSSKGAKTLNQDAFAYALHLASGKPISVFAIADGVSSSTVSQIASDYATAQLIKLFEHAPEAWSVYETATKAIKEINALLYTRNQNSAFCYTPEKGYVCTFTVLIISGNTLDIFHIGDCEVCVATPTEFTQLTQAHREVSKEDPTHSYLANALGVKASIDIDHTALSISESCAIAMSTDGVHEHTSIEAILSKVCSDDELAKGKAALVVHDAFTNGSTDNLTLILIKMLDQSSNLLTLVPKSPQTNNIGHLKVGDTFDGLVLKRQLYTSARSHVFLATAKRPASSKDTSSGANSNITHMSGKTQPSEDTQTVVIKVPATDFAQTSEDLTHVAIESWLARRITSPHVVKSPLLSELCLHVFPSAYYCLNEYVEGQTLAQWAIDNPAPSLEQVRDIIEQVANGLQAMHRQGIIHQDIRPENIMINNEGHCTIIDLGAAALIDAPRLYSDHNVPGTVLYAAPEYFLGEIGTELSDLFSLAVLTYFLLCGRYPYDTKVAQCTTLAAQRKLKYQSALDAKRPIPLWLDATLARALHIYPTKRFTTLSEYVFALRYPVPSKVHKYVPLVKRNPLSFYKVLTLLLVFTNLFTLVLFI